MGPFSSYGFPVCREYAEPFVLGRGETSAARVSDTVVGCSIVAVVFFSSFLFSLFIAARLVPPRSLGDTPTERLYYCAKGGRNRTMANARRSRAGPAAVFGAFYGGKKYTKKKSRRSYFRNNNNNTYARKKKKKRLLLYSGNNGNNDIAYRTGFARKTIRCLRRGSRGYLNARARGRTQLSRPVLVFRRRRRRGGPAYPLRQF